MEKIRLENMAAILERWKQYQTLGQELKPAFLESGEMTVKARLRTHFGIQMQGARKEPTERTPSSSRRSPRQDPVDRVDQKRELDDGLSEESVQEVEAEEEEEAVLTSSQGVLREEENSTIGNEPLGGDLQRILEKYGLVLDADEPKIVRRKNADDKEEEAKRRLEKLRQLPESTRSSSSEEWEPSSDDELPGLEEELREMNRRIELAKEKKRRRGSQRRGKQLPTPKARVSFQPHPDPSSDGSSSSEEKEEERVPSVKSIRTLDSEASTIPPEHVKGCQCSLCLHPKGCLCSSCHEVTTRVKGRNEETKSSFKSKVEIKHSLFSGGKSGSKSHQVDIFKWVEGLTVKIAIGQWSQNDKIQFAHSHLREPAVTTMNEWLLSISELPPRKKRKQRTIENFIKVLESSYSPVSPMEYYIKKFQKVRRPGMTVMEFRDFYLNARRGLRRWGSYKVSSEMAAEDFLSKLGGQVEIETRARQGSTESLETAIKTARHEESRLEELQKSDMSRQISMVSTTDKREGQAKKKPTCFNCGRKGHYKGDCKDGPPDPEGVCILQAGTVPSGMNP